MMKLQIADLRLQIVLTICDLQSAICNPQSAIHHGGN